MWHSYSVKFLAYFFLFFCPTSEALLPCRQVSQLLPQDSMYLNDSMNTLKNRKGKIQKQWETFFLSSHLDFIDTLCQFKFNQLKVHKSLSLPCVFFKSKLLRYMRQISMLFRS